MNDGRHDLNEPRKGATRTMPTITKKAQMSNLRTPDGLVDTLAHHDAAIQSLGGRMTGVESSMKTLQSEVHSGFHGIRGEFHSLQTLLGGKLDRLDARPTFDFHKTVGTVVSLAALFSMVCGGIIWITTTSLSGVIARQDGTNDKLSEKVLKQEGEIDRLREKLGWVGRVEAAP